MSKAMLDQRIAQLQDQMVPSLATIRAMIEEETRRILANALPSVAEQINTPPQDRPMDLGIQILNAIGSALTEDQQAWLSDPENQTAIPTFLRTLEGQALTRRFMTMYKDHLRHTCK